MRLSRLLILIGILAFLGVAAWGVGWGLHSLMDRGAAQSPQATAPTTLVATAMPTVLPAIASPSPVAQPTSTRAPTSTPRPPLTPTLPPRTYVVQPGQGLARIAGIVCPNLNTYQERLEFAYLIQQHNPGKVLNIDRVSAGVELVIPPCP